MGVHAVSLTTEQNRQETRAFPRFADGDTRRTDLSQVWKSQLRSGCLTAVSASRFVEAWGLLIHPDVFSYSCENVRTDRGG